MTSKGRLPRFSLQIYIFIDWQSYPHFFFLKMGWSSFIIFLCTARVGRAQDALRTGPTITGGSTPPSTLYRRLTTIMFLSPPRLDFLPPFDHWRTSPVNAFQILVQNSLNPAKKKGGAPLKERRATFQNVRPLIVHPPPLRNSIYFLPLLSYPFIRRRAWVSGGRVLAGENEFRLIQMALSRSRFH